MSALETGAGEMEMDCPPESSFVAVALQTGTVADYRPPESSSVAAALETGSCKMVTDYHPLVFDTAAAKADQAGEKDKTL